jgi:hypothetical protein
MFKISLTELEEVRSDPVAYKKKRDTTRSFFPTKSYFVTLKRAIYEYHKETNISASINYLENGLAEFKSPTQCKKTIEDLMWYIGEYQKLNWPTILKRYNISVPLSTKYMDSLKLSGEINRIDMHPSGAYAAWIFSNRSAKNWISELRMPIIQNAIAVDLSAIPITVHVGIYSFEDRVVHIHNYSIEDIRIAHLELENLFRKMGF